MPILYSTNCPRCEVLKKKLCLANIEFEEVNDIKTMQEKGIMSAPVLEVDGELLDFSRAIAWARDRM